MARFSLGVLLAGFSACAYVNAAGAGTDLTSNSSVSPGNYFGRTVSYSFSDLSVGGEVKSDVQTSEFGLRKSLVEPSIGSSVDQKKKIEDLEIKLKTLEEENRLLRAQLEKLSSLLETLTNKSKESTVTSESKGRDHTPLTQRIVSASERDDSGPVRVSEIPSLMIEKNAALSLHLHSDTEKKKKSRKMIPLHHVVYVFKNKNDQQAMWSALADKEINDRWQGVNQHRARYFIYVGAYDNQYMAQRRVHDLYQKIGVKPIMYFDGD